jgi:hypothetical protein
MSKKEFPTRGHCLSTDPIIVNYLKDNLERFQDSKYSKRSTGVAWNENKWWYITNGSSTPEYSPLTIMGIITKINEMKSFLTTGTLSTSSGIMPSSVICGITTTTTTTAAPVYNPNDSLPNTIWINGSDVYITTNLVTEPTKLRIKCRNLKKNLKVSLLQINLK